MRNLVMSKLAALIGVLIITFGIVGSVLAAAPATPTPQTDNKVLAFGIYPADKQLGAYFDPTIDAGKQVILQVVLANTGDVVFDARTYAINAGTAPNGGFRAADAGTKPEGVTTWLDYPEATYTLAPGKGVQIPLTIHVPKGTAPGQYLTALIMETANARDIEGTNVFKKVIRQAVPVFITVPGTRSPAFEIGDISLTTVQNGAALTIGIKNSGNVRVQPTGTVVVDDASGSQVLSAPIAMDSVYARDETTLTLGVPALAGGVYKVSVDLHDPDTGAKATVSGVEVTAQAPASPMPAAPISFGSATASPQPSLSKIQFLDVAVTILNNGAPVTNARLSLSVTHDGKAVEDYPLAASLALPSGTTAVQSRYIPASGWSSGTWAFTLTLEIVDPSSGVAQVIAATDLGGPIIVP